MTRHYGEGCGALERPSGKVLWEVTVELKWVLQKDVALW